MKASFILVAAFSLLIAYSFAYTFALFAQEIAIDTAADYTFGQELRFQINIVNGAEVEKITLSMRPESSNNLYVIDVPFEPGNLISTTYTIAVDEVSLLPYSQLKYSLEILTATELYQTAEDTIVYEDDRFDWQQMSRDGLTAHWTGSGPFLGQDVVLVGSEALASLSEVLPLEHISPIHIYVYSSSADLRAGLRLAGLSEASSQPELGVILVTAVNPQSAAADLGQSLPYEMARLLLYRVSGTQYENIPWWLTEGLATLVQAQPHPRYSQLIDDAIRTADTIPVQQLCQRTERAGDRELLASAQSHALVNYLLERYGREKFIDLVTAYIQGDDCEMGLGRVLDKSIEELEEDWLNAQQPSSAVSSFIS
ncbi:MAG: peptidase MA family metallohydrolase, partial [Candidatus Promineifilaceae bacterium]|nr:peptidase MA family metallohydrolase [Candidatus Promineifilaceae bacterium]